MDEWDGAGMGARLREWRRTQPQATFDEIEDAVQSELVRWQAAVVADLAGADAGDGIAAGDGADARPVCAACGVAMRRGGTRARAVLSRHGRSLRLERAC